jgi:hypothetical protein
MTAQAQVDSVIEQLQQQPPSMVLIPKCHFVEWHGPLTVKGFIEALDARKDWALVLASLTYGKLQETSDTKDFE